MTDPVLPVKIKNYHYCRFRANQKHHVPCTCFSLFVCVSEEIQEESSNVTVQSARVYDKGKSISPLKMHIFCSRVSQINICFPVDPHVCIAIP